ncbi:MAG: iron ABC transporter permease [Clostridiales bacterium]|nr:iron ABC transporter permease [Clostridiales bacterium]
MKIILILVPLAALFATLFVGRYSASVSDVITLIGSKLGLISGVELPAALESAIWNVRIPRAIVAFLSGTSLAVAGAVFQGVFRNPLVSDHVLGVSNGASFGAALALLIGLPMAVVQTSAFIFGILAVVIAFWLIRVYKNNSMLTLVLSGIIISGFFSAMVSLMKTMADPLDKMPAIVFWLMGSFAKISSKDLIYAIPAMLIPVGVLFTLRWKINVLATGDESAKALGMNTNAFRRVLILLCTFATAATVAISGVVGWVGLVIPHISRILVGPDYKKLIPVCISMGGTYLLLMDNAARMITTYEIPIGILTAAIGAPLFAFLLRKGSGWE